MRYIIYIYFIHFHNAKRPNKIGTRKRFSSDYYVEKLVPHKKKKFTLESAGNDINGKLSCIHSILRRDHVYLFLREVKTQASVAYMKTCRELEREKKVIL